MDLSKLNVSNGNGEAVRGLNTVLRSPGATVITPNSLVNWPTNFIATTGPLLADGTIDPAKMLVFIGHISGSTIVIDSLAPGYIDTYGSAVGDVVVIKPVTWWADTLVDKVRAMDLFDQTDPVQRQVETTFDYVASGGVWAGLNYGSTLTGSMTALVAYINGYRQTAPAIATKTFTASRDTYIDLLYNSSGVGTIVYTEVANNAASPALAANSIRLGIIVTGASNIANVGSINQGQHDKVLPIASSIAYTVTDSLGNLICPRDPNRRILGYRQTLSTFSTASGSPVQVTGVSVPVIIPTGRKAKLTAYSLGSSNNTAGLYALTTIWKGTVGSGTQIAQSNNLNPSAAREINVALGGLDSSSSGLTTYNLALAQGGGGTASLLATSGAPTFLMVELV